MKIKIKLASPRGYCAGVKRAIEIVDLALKEFGTPLYVNHEIIHNKFIINHFENKGVIFGKDVEEIEPWNVIIFSAHWVWPEFVKKVRKQKLRFLDASCPLVIKVHREAQKFLSEWYEIIYIGEKKHVEAMWIKENNAEKIHIISNREDLNKIALTFSSFSKGSPQNEMEREGFPSKLALLTQTTLSIDDIWSFIDDVKKKFPEIVLPKVQDICYATTNRQTAVKEICKNVDILIIVGSKNSSNSTKLKYIWEKKNINTFQIDSYTELWDEFKNLLSDKESVIIWLSSWASVPDKLVQEVISYCEAVWKVEIEKITVADEKMIFPSKLELQE